jgi:DNA polymerase V
MIGVQNNQQKSYDFLRTERVEALQKNRKNSARCPRSDVTYFSCSSSLASGKIAPRTFTLLIRFRMILKMKETKAIPLDAARLPDDAARDGLPLYLSPVAAGFPSPAEDYLDRKLDLHEYLIRNHAATFFLRASGDSMLQAGIQDGDLLVVDRSLTPGSGSVVIAAVEGELTVKYLSRREGRVWLVPANDEYPELDISDQEDAVIWGVVTYAIHKLTARALGAR